LAKRNFNHSIKLSGCNYLLFFSLLFPPPPLRQLASNEFLGGENLYQVGKPGLKVGRLFQLALVVVIIFNIQGEFERAVSPQT
jgi:hypothetical protein